MSLDDKRENSLINTKGKGIIRQCTDIIEARKQEIDKEAERQNNYNNLRASIANSVTLENFVVNNNLIFSEKDLCVVQSMIRTKHYSNDCILTTNLDDPVSVVDSILLKRNWTIFMYLMNLKNIGKPLILEILLESDWKFMKNYTIMILLS